MKWKNEQKDDLNRKSTEIEKMIYDENPIERKSSPYWFKCPVSILLFFSVIIYKENPIEMKKKSNKMI